MWYVRSFFSSLKPPKLGIDTIMKSLADTALANLPIYGILHYINYRHDDVAKLKEMQHNEDFRKQLQKNAGYDDKAHFQQSMYWLEQSYELHSVLSSTYSGLNTVVIATSLPLAYFFSPQLLLVSLYVTASTTFISFVPNIVLFGIFGNVPSSELDDKGDIQEEVNALTDTHDYCEGEMSHGFCLADVTCDM